MRPITACCWILAVAAAAPADERDPFLDITFEAARERAAKEGKPLFLDFTASWCPPCKLLDRTTWPTPRVAEWLTRRAVAIKVDGDRQRELVGRFRVQAYPTLVWLNAEGREQGRKVGFVDADGFLDLCRRWAPESFKDVPDAAPTSAPAAADDAPADDDAEHPAAPADDSAADEDEEEDAAPVVGDPFARHERARNYTEVGRYAEALADFTWCWEQGSRADRAFGPVRNAALLDDFRALGEKYPPAMAYLRGRQQEFEQRLREARGGRRALQDYLILNQAFGEPDRVLATFDALLDKPAGKQTRGALLPFVMPQLIEAQRYADIVGSVENIPQTLQRQLRLAEIAAQQPDFPRREVAKLHADILGANGMFYEALLATERQEPADRIAELLLELDPRIETYTTLIAHARRARAAEAASRLAAQAMTRFPASQHGRILAAMGGADAAAETPKP